MSKLISRILAALLAAFMCAAVTAHAAVRPHILNGHRGGIRQLVEIYFADSQGYRICSGSIIAPNVVLTAAHCADGKLASYQVEDTAALWADSVKAIDIEPGYEPSATSSAYVNDAALLVLADSVRITPLPLDPVQPLPGTTVTIQGWGDTTPTSGSGTIPMTATTTVLDTPTCLQRILVVSVSQFCAQDPDLAGLGPGDSGGPLLVPTNIGFALAGVADASASNGAVPSVFTRVDQLYVWAQRTIASVKPRRVAVHSQVASRSTKPPVPGRPRAERR